jgi:hypothetical protein
MHYGNRGIIPESAQSQNLPDLSQLQTTQIHLATFTSGK